MYYVLSFICCLFVFEYTTLFSTPVCIYRVLHILFDNSSLLNAVFKCVYPISVRENVNITIVLFCHHIYIHYYRNVTPVDSTFLVSLIITMLLSFFPNLHSYYLPNYNISGVVRHSLIVL